MTETDSGGPAEDRTGGSAAGERTGDASAGPAAGDDAVSLRARGQAKMDEVYGFSVDPDQIEGPYVAFTVDHLFGRVWTRTELGVRDRRLLTIGVLAALGQFQLVEIQFESALERDELTEDQVRETVVHLTHYIGWPLSTGVNEVAEKVIARRRKREGT